MVDGLSIKLTADSEDAEESINDTKRSLLGLESAADEAGDEMREAGSEAGVAAAKVSALGGAATGASAATGSLATSLGAIVVGAAAVLAPLTALVTGLTAVVGSGVVAYGRELAETMPEVDSAGEALAERFGEIKAQLADIVAERGEEFVSLIRAFVDGIVPFSRKLNDAIGSLEPFAELLRRIGGTGGLFIEVVRAAAAFARATARLVIKLDNLLRALSPVFSTISDIAGAVGGVSDRVRRLINEFAVLATTIGGGALGIAGLASALGAAGSVTGALTAAVGALGTALSVLTGPVGLVIAAVAALTAAIILNRETIGDAIDGLVETVQDGFSVVDDELQAYKRAVKTVLRQVTAFIRNVATGNFEQAFRNLGGVVQGVVQGQFAVGGVIWGIITSLFDSLARYIGSGRALTDLKAAVRSLGRGIRDVMTDIFGAGQAVGGTLGDIVTGFFAALAGYIKSGRALTDLKTAVRGLGRGIRTVWDTYFAIGGRLWSILTTLVARLRTYLASGRARRDLKTAVRTLTDALIGVFRGALRVRGAIWKLFTGLVSALGTYLASGRARRDLVAALATLTGALMEVFQAFVDGLFYNSLLKDLFRDAAAWVRETGQTLLRGAFAAVADAVEDALDIDLDGVLTSIRDLAAAAQDALDTLQSLNDLDVSVDIPDVPDFGGGGGGDGGGGGGSGGGDDGNDGDGSPSPPPNDTLPGDGDSGGGGGGGGGGMIELDTGGLVRSGGVATLHAGERVVPAAQVSDRGAVELDTDGVEQELRRNRDAIRDLADALNVEVRVENPGGRYDGI